MKKKSWYAVRKGRKTGLYTTWEECKKQVIGYPNASYKGFYTKEEATAFLQEAANSVKECNAPISSECVVAYVDGSYIPSMPEFFAFGCVILFRGKIEKYADKIKNKELALMRNVAGEIHGAMFAMKYCITHQIKEMDLYYDYAGIEKWCIGEWKTNKNGTKALKAYYDSIKENLTIRFHKVISHTGVKYNEMADQLAKEALCRKK